MLYRCSLILLVGCAQAGTTEQQQSTPDAATTVDAAPMPDAPPPCTASAMTQLLMNPAFDAAGSWTESPINAAYPIITTDDGIAEQTPSRKAWMGGYAQANANDQLYQDVMVPATTTMVQFRGYYAVGTTEASTAAVKDTATIQLADPTGTVYDTVITLDNKMPSTTWMPIDKTIPATMFAGKPVRVLFKSSNDGTAHTNFFFDSFTLTATHCP